MADKIRRRTHEEDGGEVPKITFVEDDEDIDEDGRWRAAEEEEPADVAHEELVDTRSPVQKTLDLLASMEPQRRVLLAILRHCDEPRPVAEVNELVASLQRDRCTVFSAASLCGHLEAAGALSKVTAEGFPYAEPAGNPEIVLVDGVECFRPPAHIEAFWMATEDGREAAGHDRPQERLAALAERDGRCLPVYRLVLELCGAGDGATRAELADAVDGHPLAQDPRRYSSYFTEKLETCDAIEWRGKWVATEAGCAFLASLP